MHFGGKGVWVEWMIIAFSDNKYLNFDNDDNDNDDQDDDDDDNDGGYDDEDDDDDDESSCSICPFASSGFVRGIVTERGRKGTTWLCSL